MAKNNKNKANESNVIPEPTPFCPSKPVAIEPMVPTIGFAKKPAIDERKPMTALS